MIPHRDNDPTECRSPPLALCRHEDVTAEPSSAKREESPTVQADRPSKPEQQCCEETRSRSTLPRHRSAQWQHLPTGSSSCRSPAANSLLGYAGWSPSAPFMTPWKRISLLADTKVLEGLTPSRQKHKILFIIRDVNETRR